MHPPRVNPQALFHKLDLFGVVDFDAWDPFDFFTVPVARIVLFQKLRITLKLVLVPGLGSNNVIIDSQ